MNTVIITSVLSCGNAGMYVSTRMLYSLAEEGKAPKIFAKCNKRGVPIYALNATTVIAAFCFLTAQVSVNTVYFGSLTYPHMTGFIARLAIAISHYCFRRAYVAQGKKIEDMKFKAKFYPSRPLFAAILCACIILGQYYAYGEYSTRRILRSLIGLIIFFGCYFGYKFPRRQSFVKPTEAVFHTMKDRAYKTKPLYILTAVLLVY
jgi:lysine-specific permease